jgi:hypothetical protein
LGENRRVSVEGRVSEFKKGDGSKKVGKGKGKGEVAVTFI